MITKSCKKMLYVKCIKKIIIYWKILNYGAKNNFSKYVKNMILNHKGFIFIFHFSKYFLW